MECKGTFKPIAEFEQLQLSQGELPDRIAMGAWRPLQPGEVVDHRFISVISGVESVPARLYGNPQLSIENVILMPMGSNSELSPTMLYADEAVLVGQ